MQFTILNCTQCKLTINLLALSQSDCRNFYSHMIICYTSKASENLTKFCLCCCCCCCCCCNMTCLTLCVQKLDIRETEMSAMVWSVSVSHPLTHIYKYIFSFLYYTSKASENMTKFWNRKCLCCCGNMTCLVISLCVSKNFLETEMSAMISVILLGEKWVRIFVLNWYFFLGHFLVGFGHWRDRCCCH